jgi:CHASE2 domain-containing sensor protein
MNKVWPGRAGLLGLMALWFGLTGPLSPLDRWGFDLYLRLRRDHAPPVSSQIVHLDIGQQELTGWASTRQEYAGLAEMIGQLRRQGAQVIVLDLMLMRGEKADFMPFWEQIKSGQQDIVLGRTFADTSRLPAGSQVSEGLLYLNSDSDGRLRCYDWVRTDPKRKKVYPSLALAAYIKLLGLEFKPEWVQSDGRLQFPDVTPEGDSYPRPLPAQVLLDERALWTEASPRNFFHLSLTLLREWSQKPGPPRLAGKVVFVGYVAPGSGDLGATPLNRSIPKVAVHSLALNGLMQDSWYVPWPALRSFQAALTLVLLSWVVGRLPRLWLSLSWLGGMLALGAGGLALMVYAHSFPWLISLWIGWTASLIWESWTRDKIRHSRLLALQHLADSEDPLLLKVVGKYQIIRKLGTGGFATVYQAVPTDSLDPARSIALKIVHPASAESPEFRRRFLREIRISSQLRHPNIVKVFHSGDEVGLLYMAMELVEGRPLKHYLQSGSPRSADEVLQILLPLLHGLAYAHGLQVVHRDLKPDNLMVQLENEVEAPWKVSALKIVDFGLAFDSQASQLTRTGEVFGTLDYLAPERIQGKADDPRSDLYAVGVIAYEMLSGSNPFQQQNPGEAILFRLTADPRPLSELQPNLPPALVQVVTRLLARDPEERFSSAQEVLAALE